MRWMVVVRSVLLLEATGMSRDSTTTVRARHETTNRIFKTYKCLRDMFRYDRELCGEVAHAIIVQLGIKEDGFTWCVDYGEDEFSVLAVLVVVCYSAS